MLYPSPKKNVREDCHIVMRGKLTTVLYGGGGVIIHLKGKGRLKVKEMRKNGATRIDIVKAITLEHTFSGFAIFEDKYGYYFCLGEWLKDRGEWRDSRLHYHTYRPHGKIEIYWLLKLGYIKARDLNWEFNQHNDFKPLED